jgi:hypothetical protein
MTMIERVERHLPGWKAQQLSIGRRHTLTNSVLTTTPTYFMSEFMLPKWVVRAIDKIRKCFLWHGHKEIHDTEKRVICLANWQLVTKPKELGGMEIRDIGSMNKSLLLKWMWSWIKDDDAWWKEITITGEEHIRPWELARPSPF